MFKKGEHVQDKDGHTGHITAIYGLISGDLIVEVQWDHAPWGSRVLWHEHDLVHDIPADARSAARSEQDRKAYNEASAAGRYQGD